MTTATKAKPSASERDRDLEAALAEADAARDETDQRAREHRERIEGLKAQLAERAITNPGEFGATGVPRAKAPAGKIADEIRTLIEADNFAAMAAGARGRVERAQQALADHRNQQGRELFAEMVPEARRVVDDWLAWAAEGRAKYEAMVRAATRAHRLTVTTRLYNRQGSVPDYEHARYVLGLAEQTPPLPLPGRFVEEMEAEEMEEVEDE